MKKSIKSIFRQPFFLTFTSEYFGDSGVGELCKNAGERIYEIGLLLAKGNGSIKL